MTPKEIQFVKSLFDSALMYWSESATVDAVGSERVCKVTFRLWKRNFVGNFVLTDQGLRTHGTTFFWVNTSEHVWQWVAMILADFLDSLVGLEPVSPLIALQNPEPLCDICKINLCDECRSR